MAIWGYSIKVWQTLNSFLNYLSWKLFLWCSMWVCIPSWQAQGQGPVQSPSASQSQNKRKGNLASGLSLKSALTNINKDIVKKVIPYPELNIPGLAQSLSLLTMSLVVNLSLNLTFWKFYMEYDVLYPYIKVHRNN